MWYVRPSKPQISLRIRAVWSEHLLVVLTLHELKLPNEHLLEVLSLKRGRAGSSESTLVKMSNCWKSHSTTQMSSFPMTKIVDWDVKHQHKQTKQIDVNQSIR